jgi:predicted enzyme related to lactoylglutathione lyase
MARAIVFTDSAGNPPVIPVQGVLLTAQIKQVGFVLKSLGFVVAMRKEPSGSQFLVAQCRGLSLKISQAAKPEPQAAGPLYFRVANLNAVVAAAAAQGATILSPAADLPRGRMATLADPDGRRIVLLQPSDEPTALTEHECRAIEAVKRGAVVMLVGHTLQLIVAVPCMFSLLTFMVEKRDWGVAVISYNEQTLILLCAGILLGGFATLAGKIMCAFPTSARINYLGLIAACVIEIATIALIFMTGAFPVKPLEIVTSAAYVVSIATPLMTIEFLRNVMKIARNEPAIVHGQRTLAAYFPFAVVTTWAILLEADIAYSWLETGLSYSKRGVFFAIVLAFVYIPIHFLFLYQVATTKTAER